MVCSYSFELSQKTVPRTFILNCHLIYPYLEAIEKVSFFFLFNAFPHQNMECRYSFELSQKTVPTTFILNYYLICSYLRAIEKAYPDIKTK